MLCRREGEEGGEGPKSVVAVATGESCCLRKLSTGKMPSRPYRPWSVRSISNTRYYFSLFFFIVKIVIALLSWTLQLWLLLLGYFSPLSLPCSLFSSCTLARTSSHTFKNEAYLYLHKPREERCKVHNTKQSIKHPANNNNSNKSETATVITRLHVFLHVHLKRLWCGRACAYACLCNHGVHVRSCACCSVCVVRIFYVLAMRSHMCHCAAVGTAVLYHLLTP